MSRVSAVLFSVVTPLGFSVRTTEAYWLFIEHKHPEVRARLDRVKQCLVAPDMVRRSKQDPSVYLFYSKISPYHLVVAVKRLNGEGFIVTSYVTDKVKEGEIVWPTSE